VTLTIGPWASPPTLPEPRRRSRTVPVLLILAGVGMLLCAGGSAAAVAIPNTVVVEISGPGTAHITWWVDGVPAGVDDPATLPWRREVESGIGVRAQLNGTGEIVCTADGKRASTEGVFPWVACPG